MRPTPYLPLALIVTLSLALAGCGDDGGGEAELDPFGSGGPSLPYGIDPSKLDPAARDGVEAAKRASERFMKGVLDTKFTEESLAKFYELHKELESMADSDDVGAKFALFREHGMSMGTYTATLMKLSSLRSVLRDGVEKTKQEFAEAENRLEELKQEAAAATGDAKQALEQQINMYGMMMPAMQAQLDQAKQLEDPGFRALMEKWVEKFDALEK